VNNFHIRTLVLVSLAVANSPLLASDFLSQQPMGSSIDPAVKPNVIFVLDSSGSMEWTHIGDMPLGPYNSGGSASNSFGGDTHGLSKSYGYASFQCNPMYFNPDTSFTYDVPVMADGSDINAGSPTIFTAAYKDGYAGGTKVNLSLSTFQAYTTATSYDVYNDTLQPAYYYKYTGTHPAPANHFVYSVDGSGNMSVDKTSAFYKECASPVGSAPGNGVFTKVLLNGESASEKARFARWYSYYRSRIMMMKSAAGLALKQINNPDNVRIGFTKVQGGNVITSTASGFVPIRDYGNLTGASATNTCPATVANGQDQRSCLYKQLYAASPSNGTPTRSALDLAGQMYKGSGSLVGTGKPDPVLYSCQRNSTILASDGYWNTDSITSAGNADSSGSTSTCPACDTSPASSNSMADIAAYYYKTDLRTSGSLSANNVPTNSKDPANWQHMNSYTLGLGAPQKLNYVAGYESETATYCGSHTCSDYLGLTAGTTKWPDPTPKENLTRIDDLWHAAVNGRGTFFNAANVKDVANGLKQAFAGSMTNGSGSGASTGNLAPQPGANNSVYLARFKIDPKTGESSGDVRQYQIDADTGVVPDPDVTAPDWSAQTQLDLMVGDSTDTRIIYIAKGPTTLGLFNKTDLLAHPAAPIANNWFNPGPTNPNGQLEQYPFYSAAQITNATNVDNMIAYLRGRRAWEDATNNLFETDPAANAKLFRGRVHALGDIVGSQPSFVQKPPFDYEDSSYSGAGGYKSIGRAGMVYVGANDGMLHAFDSSTGVERWAFVPTAVLPYMYKLADKNFTGKHQYFVNGPITIGDVEFGSGNWRTVLVSGLGRGGRALFALDITNPLSPSLLWEFSAKASSGACVGSTSTTTCDQDLGYTYGNAPMAKLNGGQWVVFFGSGYLNEAPPASPPPPTSPPVLAGDGDSRLYVLDVQTGAKIAEIPTASGSDSKLNGLSWVNGWTDRGMQNNSVKHVYGGDLSGRVWRFDIAAGTKTLLTTLKGPGGNLQPVTTRPALGDFKSTITNRVVYVGTGKYLGFDDIVDTSTQSLYAIRDDNSNPPTSLKHDIGGAGGFRSSGAIALFSAGNRNGGLVYNNVASNQYGWYLDFTADAGERVVVNPLLYGDQQNLSVITNLPSNEKCDIGGKSWAYFLDTQRAKAEAVTTLTDTVQYIGSVLGVGATNLTLESGKHVTIVTTSAGKTVTVGGGTPTYGNKARRVSWRELKN
jgi:type IV pilus assembly protein PilY1